MRLPPAGLTGDWASGYTGFGAQFDALSGLLSVCGHFGDSDPTDYSRDDIHGRRFWTGRSPGGHGRTTLPAATGRGQVVELSQSENVVNHMGDMFVDSQFGVEPERWGNRDPWRAPQGLYPSLEPNRWIAISVPDDPTWRSLADAIGRADLASAPRFADAPSRRANHTELDELLSAWTSARPMLEAFHFLQSAGIPAGPLLDDKLFTGDPHMVERGWFRPLESGDVGIHLHPGLASPASPTPGSAVHPPSAKTTNSSTRSCSGSPTTNTIASSARRSWQPTTSCRTEHRTNLSRTG